jgi:kynurenine formamidase
MKLIDVTVWLPLQVVGSDGAPARVVLRTG